MKLSLGAIAVSMAFVISPVNADIESDCKLILNSAQEVFPQFFSSKPETNNIGPWCFRHYIEKGIYLGVFRGGDGFKKAGVYALGDVFGNSPLYLGQTESVLDLLSSQAVGTAKGEICDSVSDDFSFKRKGDITTVSSDGDCIVITENDRICDVLPALDNEGEIIATGIHALTHTNISNFELNGFSLPNIPNIPGLSKLDDPFDFLEKDLADQSSCIIHAPEHFTAHKVKSDICLDMSEALKGFSDLPGVTLPLTVDIKSETDAKIVDDCFKTDATTIVNLETHESWTNKNGRFEKD